MKKIIFFLIAIAALAFAAQASEFSVSPGTTSVEPAIENSLSGLSQPVDETERTSAPTFNGYTMDGYVGFGIQIYPTEPSTIYYRTHYPNGEWTDWMEYTEELWFTTLGHYRVEAYAVADGKTASQMIAYEFVVMETVPAPEFNWYTVDGWQGTYVEIVDADPDCSIMYNVQYPSGQWTGWMEYNETLLFTEPGNYLIDAYAYADGKNRSDVVTIEIVVQEVTWAPTFNGFTVDGVAGYGVQINESETSTIYYRLMYPFPDGEWTDWMEYTGELWLTDAGRYRVEAYAVADGKTPSQMIAYEFVVLEQTPNPEFNRYTIDGMRGTYVEILDAEPSCTIWYNVQYPSGEWTDMKRYTEPLLFTAPGHYVVRAYAFADGMYQSELVTCEFEVQEQTLHPTFNGYTIDGYVGFGVQIYPTEPSTIYYRTHYPNGEWTDWMEYTEELWFTTLGHYRVEAYAVADGKTASQMIAYEFVVMETVPAPEFNWYTVDGWQGTYVEIADTDPDCTIMYNVQYPSGQWTGWMEYNEPLLFTEPGYYLIDAYAYADGKNRSDVVTIEIVVQEVTWAPTFNGFTVDGVAGYGVQINESETSTIYYRLMYPFPDGEWTDWMEYTGELWLTDAGRYRVEAYAVADGKTPSQMIAYEFVVLEQTPNPEFNRYTIDGMRGTYVEILDAEPSCTIWYNVQYPSGEWTDMKRYTEPLLFTAPGHYVVRAYAFADGMYQSELVTCEFEVQEQTLHPTFNGFTIDGVVGYGVQIIEREPNCTIYYRTQYPCPDGEWSDWMEYTGELMFTEVGRHRVESYAVASGKSASETVAYEFTVVDIAQPGDVNGDGWVNIEDVSDLIDILLNKSTPTQGCDVNQDGEVNITDVSDLIDLLLGHE